MANWKIGAVSVTKVVESEVALRFHHLLVDADPAALVGADWLEPYMSGKTLEASIRNDPDDIHEPIDWTNAVRGVPAPKEHINIRIDHDVLAWFKASGRGYQTLMNNVLRAFVLSRQQR